MPKKKAVFLFGAGAVLDWGAPSTSFLTDLILNTGFRTKEGVRITRLIFEKLKATGVKESDINFETIINFIEELYNHAYITRLHKNHNAKNKILPLPSFYTLVNLDELISEFTGYEVTDVNQKTGKYSLVIPGYLRGKEEYISLEISPEEKYFELLINDLLGGIVGHVSKYSYCTESHNVIFTPANEELNTLFIRWVKSFYDNNYILRTYTLNYDRLFKLLMSENGINVFEGFSTNGSFAGIGINLNANLPKILTDFESNVHYNLHGSAYWGVDEYNVNQLPGYQYYLNDVPIVESNSRMAVVNLEKGRRVLLSNIITGYQKLQRTSISPFRQLFAAFDRDCFEADELYIIGYSYGDEHINDIIRNARKYNPKLLIFLISPSFDDEKVMFEFLLHWNRPRGFIYKNEGKDVVISEDFNVIAIKKKFGEYLKEYNYLQELLWKNLFNHAQRE